MGTPIPAGTRAQVGLAAGASMAIKGHGGTVQVVAPQRPGIVGVQQPIGPNGTAVGPFDVDATVQIVAPASGAEYELSSPDDIVDREGGLGFADAQADALAAAMSGAPLAITLDGSNRLATMTNGTTGRVAPITYTDSTHLTISDNQTNQAVGTLALDAGGRLVSYSGNFP